MFPEIRCLDGLKFSAEFSPSELRNMTSDDKACWGEVSLELGLAGCQINNNNNHRNKKKNNES